MEKGWLSGISIPLYLLVIVFNLASFIDLNAVWTEMPLLVNRLPEGWELPAYFVLLSNAAKISLIVYVILKKYLKNRLKEYPFVYAIIVIGASCLFIMGFVWDRTSIVAGKEVSLVLMILTFILSFMDSLSSVVFLPYLSRFRAQYITAYLVGEGMCQLLPAVAGIIQGVGESPDCQNHTVITYNETTMMNSTTYQIVPIYPDPRFSVQAFFIMMCGIMVLSGVAFTLIHYLPHFKNQRMDRQEQTDNIGEELKVNPKSSELNDTVDVGDNITSHKLRHLHKDPNDSKDIHGEHMENSSKTKITEKKLSRGDFVFCLVLVTWRLGISFGLMPGIQSYSALPYGNGAYNLSLRLASAVNPITSFLALFVYTRSKAWISFVYIILTAATIHQVVLACYSPHPPLKGTAAGEALVVSTS